ncbi:MAG TPA: cell division protein FtsQ/DivIB [Gammaproteobacteria bacterium]|nr:cell division protein FtsQ/DivIB [Gammaproteobacteria bacterium]
MHTLVSNEVEPAAIAPRGRGVVAIGFFIALTAAVISLLVHLNARPITSVRIAGEFVNVSRDEMQHLLDEFLPSGFFELDVVAVRREAKRIPWVRRVSVRRIWPDSLHVAVVERVAVARWNGEALLEADGTQFVPDEPSLMGDFVDLAGPDGSEESVLERFEQMTPVAKALGTTITTVALDNRGAWRVDLSSGLTLRLGQGDRLGQVAPYVAALPQILGDRFGDAAGIDLRYSNGFAVKWRKHATPEEGQAS